MHTPESIEAALARLMPPALSETGQRAIEDMLDVGLPRAYDKSLYQQKCSALFEHLYESYLERDASVYSDQAS